MGSKRRAKNFIREGYRQIGTYVMTPRIAVPKGLLGYAGDHLFVLVQLFMAQHKCCVKYELSIVNDKGIIIISYTARATLISLTRGV